MGLTRLMNLIRCHFGLTLLEVLPFWISLLLEFLYSLLFRDFTKKKFNALLPSLNGLPEKLTSL